MTPFLFECIKDLYEKDRNRFHEICIVVPNKRAGVFITKYISEIISEPVFLPKIISINELMISISEINIIDSFVLIYKLYGAYKNHIETTESFDEFYYWGEMLLNDFDDIDKYNIDAQKLFTNIKEFKDIDSHFQYLTEEQLGIIKQFWGTLIAENLSENQKQFQNVWSKLWLVYNEFTNSLMHEKIGYEGLAYSIVIEKLLKHSDNIFPLKKYAFIGFNALNNCEHQLFQELKRQGKASFYWDTDEYYYTSSIHEAGYFIQNNIKKYGSEFPSLPNNLLDGKQIQIISAPSSVSQIKHLPTIISSWIQNGKDLSKCAIVLCDESLLLPAMYSLPPQIKAVNITMGFPITVTPVFATIQNLLKLHRNVKKNGFLYVDVVDVLNDTLIKEIIEEIPLDRIHSTAKHKYDAISPDLFSDISVLAALFCGLTSGINVLDYLKKIIVLIAETYKKKTDNAIITSITQECLYAVYTTINSIETMLKDLDQDLELSLVAAVFLKALRSQKVALAGEPLAGMQIIGILESRLLDFENVVMISVNEGILPTGRTSSSFIPFSLRQGFGLPTIKQQDAIYAYYFYRFIQRAENVVLLYTTQTNDNNLGERSRYISQIICNDDFQKSEKHISINLSPVDFDDSVIPKTEAVLNVLKKKYTGNGAGLSPSVLNTYLDCQVKFYYQNIEGISEPEELLELPDEKEFGDLYHKAIQLIYKEFVNKELCDDDFKRLMSNDMIDQCVRQAFADIYNSGNTLKSIDGYKKIIFDVVKQYVENTIRFDSQELPFTIQGLEESILGVKMNLNVNEETIDVVFKGIIDRIDCKDNTIKIIDYKTGRRDNTASDLQTLFSLKHDDDEEQKDVNRNGKLFQTMFYSYLYNRKTGHRHIVPLLYFVKESVISRDLHVYIEKQKVLSFEHYADEFENLLRLVLLQMFDKTIPFQKTTNTKRCSFCAYRDFCKR